MFWYGKTYEPNTSFKAMHVRIKTIGNTPLPKYETAGAVGFDLTAREKTLIKAKSLGLVPTGCIIEVPAGFMLHVGARSSTPKKKGLLVPHGFGIIDQDYCGEGDEILLQFYNFTDNDVTVEAGERVGQGVFVKVEQATWEKTEHMDKKTRGGFGSTN
jgi:dUTP pyrophosphatase